ncbi:hypothetical protein C8F04DRAFT_1404362 [Mycena alexandri]|uniref:Uncharacterized protein n=1 Tax=Mycena alexandri TaxID=1745969 RepID=A0AAD6WM31_9AGAR|nr:hypothetical protein C8F04DRAFT_1404362 [Mycena alexandri]
MSLKLTGSAALLGLIVCLSLISVCYASPPWTPDDFDWSSLPVAPREQWVGRYLNLTEHPLPNHPKIALLMEVGEPGKIDGYDVLLLPFAIGLAWQAVNFVVGVGSTATAIQGCATSDGSAGSIAGCVFGIAGTLLSIGSAFKAASTAGWFAKANNGFGGSGIENIALDVFTKRAQDLHQEHHDDLMRRVLGGFSPESVEFLGYAPEAHRLARRSEGHLHPHAPVFRFMHPRHGLMDIVSREHVNSTRFTVSYAAPHTRIGRRQSFQHETLSSDLFEARFDGGTEGDDPGADFNAASGYQQVESAISCVGDGTWRAGQVLSAQMYDRSLDTTFAFASMGIIADDSADGALQSFTPQGMPLPYASC